MEMTKYVIIKNEKDWTGTKSKKMRKVFDDYGEARCYIIDLPKSKANKTITFTYDIEEVNV